MVPAAIQLNKLSKQLKTAQQVHAALAFQKSERVLSLGIPSLDDALPEHGLAYGQVIELRARGASGAVTSFALCACRAAQCRAAQCRADQGAAGHWQGRSQHAWMNGQWCAFIDPTATLFAPGLAQLGVQLNRLLIVRPDVESVARVAVRIAEAKIVSVLVIDLRGAMGDLSFDGHRWQRTIRRLSLVVKQLATCVLVMTQAQPHQALPLPVSMRLEFNRPSSEFFEMRVAKERTGRISPPRTVAWSAFEVVTS